MLKRKGAAASSGGSQGRRGEHQPASKQHHEGGRMRDAGLVLPSFDVSSDR